MAKDNKTENGRFRKRKVTFAQVSNVALRDSNLSLKAKGLYSIIQSYITMEDFVLYKSYLMKLSTDKETSFKGAWKELKEAGYLVQYKLQDEKGFFYYEYELLDELKVDSKPIELHEINNDNVVSKNPEVENHSMDIPGVENPPVDFPPYGKSTSGKSTPINNTNLSNTLTNNTNLSIYPENDGLIDELNIIYEQLDLNTLKAQYPLDVDLITELEVLIHDMYTSNFTKVNGELKPRQVILHNLIRLNFNHIEAVLLTFKEEITQREVKNPTSYLKTMIYNSVMGSSAQVQSQVAYKLGY